MSVGDTEDNLPIFGNYSCMPRVLRAERTGVAPRRSTDYPLRQLGNLFSKFLPSCGKSKPVPFYSWRDGSGGRQLCREDYTTQPESTTPVLR
jgi:hypothetical protein